jgi:hypothetical protein
MSFHRINEYEEESAEKLLDAMRCEKLFCIGLTDTGALRYMKAKLKSAETGFFDYVLDAEIMTIINKLKRGNSDESK